MSSDFFWRRPEDDPLPAQPLHVRSVADRQFEAWQQEVQSVQPYHKIQWCVSGWAELRLAGKVWRMEPGQVAHLPPHSEHWARAGADGWRSCWLTFEQDTSDVIFASFALEKACLLDVGTCPVNDFKLIYELVTSIGRQADRRSGAMAYQILSNIVESGELGANDSIIDQALAILQAHWSDADFSIDDLAQRCNMHRSQLSRLFGKHIGVAPSRYLTRLRLQHASMMLLGGELNSNQIAEACGFKDASYFARVFRKAYAKSPNQYKKSQEQ